MKNHPRRAGLALAAAASILWAGAAFAAFRTADVSAPVGTVPGGINYQGRLIDNGFPVTATRSMNFRLYDSAAGGTLLWSSGPQPVVVSQGIFGASLSISTTALAGPLQKYLEVQVDGTILTPREALASVPYALIAKALEENVVISSITVGNQLISSGTLTVTAMAGYPGFNGISVSTNMVVASSVAATAFFGDGQHLTGIPSTGSIVGVYVQKAGDGMSGALNMTNANVSLTGAAGNVVGQASMTASAFFGDGSHLSGIPSTGSITGTFVQKAGDTMTGTLNLTGAAAKIVGQSSVTASAFFGDASHLTGAVDSTKLPTAGGSMTGALTLSNVALNLTGASGNVVGQSSVTASAFFGDASHLTGAVDSTKLPTAGGTMTGKLTMNNGLLLSPQTKAALVLLVPTAAGETYYCTTCVPPKIVVATGTAAGNFADAVGGTFQ